MQTDTGCNCQIQAVDFIVVRDDDAVAKVLQLLGKARCFVAENKREYKILNGAEFNRELGSLLDMDVSFDVQKVILPATLCITPTDIISLSDFIEIEGDEDG